MGKLGLGKLPQQIAMLDTCIGSRLPSGPRPTSRAGRRLYDTQRWKRERQQFLAKNQMCVHCKAQGRNTVAEVVDHVTPHRDDAKLFYDPTNWQPLCKTCHSRKTSSRDGGFGNPRRY